MSRRLRSLIALGALAVASFACGIPTDEEPRALPPTPVPSPTATETAASPRTEQIFLLDPDDRLVAVDREVDPARPIASLVAALAQEPEAADQAAGYVTSVPADTVVLDVAETADGVWRVDLGGFLESAGDAEAQVRPLAQIVYSLTALEEVDALLFLFDGEQSNVPADTGELEPTDPVTPDDYASYRPLGGT